MKRLLTFALAVLMVLSVTVTVSATELVTIESGAVSGGQSGDVTVDVLGWEAKYYVNVSWDSLKFTYTAGWNPETHRYDRDASEWLNESQANKATITVTNHSNVDVLYTAELENGGAVKNGVKAILDGTDAIDGDNYTVSGVLLSGDGLTKDNADYETFTVSVEGFVNTSEVVTVDTVTVRIHKVATASA